MTADEWASKWGITQALDVSVGEGWIPLLERLCVDLQKLGFDFSSVCQVKEKFGGLRFYHYNDARDEVMAAIDRAESESLCTCEECGAPGKPRRGGWIKTLCDVHAKESK